MPTYYVDSAATGAADGSSEADAWTTIDTAMNNVAAGDKVWVKASATYSEQATIDTAGTAGNFITFEGYTSTTGDGGRATISGSTYCITSALNADIHYHFKNLRLTGASSHGYFSNSSDTVIFENCYFDNNGGKGARGDIDYSFVNCVFHTNTDVGADADSGGFRGCIFYGNVGAIFSLAGSFAEGVFGCVAYNNGATADVFRDINGPFVGNTIDGDGTTGFLAELGSGCRACHDNIFYDATTAMTVTGLLDSNKIAMFGHNLINGCTNSYYDGVDERSTAEQPLIGSQDVTGAPAFTDEASDDYTLGEASPAIGAGLTPGGIT